MYFTTYRQWIKRFEILPLERVRKVWTVLKHVVGLKMCVLNTAWNLPKNPVFSLFRPGELGGQQYQSSWTMAQKVLDGDRGNWLGPKRPIGNEYRLVSDRYRLMGPKSATNSDSSAQSCDNFKTGPQNTQLNTFQTLYFLVPISKNEFTGGSFQDCQEFWNVRQTRIFERGFPNAVGITNSEWVPSRYYRVWEVWKLEGKMVTEV